MNTHNKECDLRVIRTKKLLCKAFKAILVKKSFEAITVNEICQEAMVHRTTFYKYFTDKYDLLRFCYGVTHDELMKNIALDKKDGQDVDSLISEKLVKTFIENKGIFENVVAAENAFCIGNMMNEVVSEAIHKSIKDGLIKNKTMVPDELVSKFFAGGFLAVAKWYCKNNKKVSVEELRAYIYKFIKEINNFGDGM